MKFIDRISSYYSFIKTSFRNQEIDRINAASYLMNKYADQLENDQKQEFKKSEFQVYSQNGEDGILLYIFSKIGVTDKRFIEFGVGDGSQCNSSNLLINFGWSGLFIEGNEKAVSRGKKFFSRSGIDRIQFKNAFITKDNINKLFEEHNITGEIDLLNIDIDGNDYWIWDQINVVNPRVVVIEYNGSFGNEKAYTIPYKADFERWSHHKSGWYHGASLKALEKLSIKKGYKLIACDSTGANAFFVRKDIQEFETLSSDFAFYPNQKRGETHPNPEDQLKLLSKLPLEEV